MVHRAPGPQGLAVFWTPLDVLTWPCRLWRVDDLADPVTVSTHPFYLRCTAFTVVDELPGWQVFGPHGEAVARLESQIGDLITKRVDAVAALAVGAPNLLRNKEYESLTARWRRASTHR